MRMIQQGTGVLSRGDENGPATSGVALRGGGSFVLRSLREKPPAFRRDGRLV
jgi:hypothetical protein